MKKSLGFATIFLLVTLNLFAQTAVPDTLFKQASLRYAIHQYQHFTGSQARINNGPQEYNYVNSIEGTAYFMGNQFQYGSVFYWGLPFDSVRILYDAYKDQVILLSHNDIRLVLLREKLDSFNLAGLSFKKHENDPFTQAGLEPGFYQHLYEGKKICALVKRTKLLNEKVTDKVEQKFLDNDKYLLFYQGQYHSFQNYRTFLKKLPANSEEIRRYIHDKGLDFKKDRDLTIRSALAFFDTLN